MTDRNEKETKMHLSLSQDSVNELIKIAMRIDPYSPLVNELMAQEREELLFVRKKEFAYLQKLVENDDTITAIICIRVLQNMMKDTAYALALSTLSS